MPKFSEASAAKLQTCDPRLQRVFYEVIKHYDCTIIEGYRGERDQNEAFQNGNSKLRWPQSKHNQMPSLAVDVMPYPIDWKDLERLTLFAGFVLGTTKSLGITRRWGADWDSDWDLKEEKFRDYPHFELVEG